MTRGFFRLKTPSMLWREDLDALSNKLEEVEEKERQEEVTVNKKTSKALVCINKYIFTVTTISFIFIITPFSLT